jgi:hypothetical protein
MWHSVIPGEGRLLIVWHIVARRLFVLVDALFGLGGIPVLSVGRTGWQPRLG